MDSLYNQKISNANEVFANSFLNAKTLYLYCFNVLPSIHFINDIEGEKYLKRSGKNRQLILGIYIELANPGEVFQELRARETIGFKGATVWAN